MSERRSPTAWWLRRFPNCLAAGVAAGDSIGVYFESAAVIILLVLVGQIIEIKARERTGDAIRSLIDLSPKTALRVDEAGHETEVPLEQIRPGDCLIVKPGGAVSRRWRRRGGLLVCR